MKNKVLYIGNFSFPTGNAAGARVLGNGYLLRELGYNVFYVGLNNSLSSDSLLESTKQFYNHFRYYNLPYPVGIKGWLSYKARFKDVMSLIKDEELYAVIIYGSPTISLFDNLIRRWCRKNKIKFLTDCVDWLPSGAGGFFFRLAKFFDTTYQKKYLNSKADGVIAISSYLSNYYNNRGCKTVVIPPIVNIDNFKKLYNNNNHNDIIKLIYVGQPFPVDGRIVKESSYKDRLDKVIDILYCLRDLQFVFNIYGLTKDQYLSVIPGQKDLLDVLGNKIMFCGYIENHEAIKKIAESDFTVLFRDVNRMTTAGFPTKFVETISCGTPIITNRTSDLKQYLQDGKNGYFVEIEDKARLLAKIKEILMLNRDSISLMKKYCQESELFSYHKFKNKMCQFLNSINVT
ncbi:MAG: glycosyltransferase [Syntrophales bacterium]